MTQAFNLSQFANKVNTSGQADLTTAVTGTLPVANGGSGQTTYTDGQLLIGNTTGNTLTKSTLTAGSGVTITNGSGAITIAAAGGGFSNMQVFASPGTFTTPATTTKIKITVVGGGGQTGNPGLPGGGGGGGGFAQYVGPVTASTPYPVTVGAVPAGTSSFGSLCSATGGAAGSSGPSGPFPAPTLYAGGAGGSPTAGTWGVSGGPGAPNKQNVALRAGSLLSTIGNSPTATPGASAGYGVGSATTIAATASAGIVIVEY